MGSSSTLYPFRRGPTMRFLIRAQVPARQSVLAAWEQMPHLRLLLCMFQSYFFSRHFVLTRSSPPAHRVSTGVVVGSAIAAVVGLILLALGLYLHCRRRIRHQREAHDRHNVLWQQECAPVDPFRTPPASVMSHYAPESTVTSSSPYASSAYISAPPSSTTPSHTFEQQSLYHASSEASAAAVVTQGATYATNAKSEKHRLIALNAEISAAGPSGINGNNPHEDFPPPGYGQVFPSSHTR